VNERCDERIADLAEAPGRSLLIVRFVPHLFVH
jgi:hypothetical protein